MGSREKLCLGVGQARQVVEQNCYRPNFQFPDLGTNFRFKQKNIVIAAATGTYMQRLLQSRLIHVQYQTRMNGRINKRTNRQMSEQTIERMNERNRNVFVAEKTVSNSSDTLLDCRQFSLSHFQTTSSGLRRKNCVFAIHHL